LILGGVKIPYEMGLDGHSDADVLVHAIMDALLGALALGDIGSLFPDTASEFKGISSLALLARVSAQVSSKGYKVENIDATVIAERPKLSPFTGAMCKNISEILKIPVDCVNIKATTEEGLGFTGQKFGIAAHAVTLLV